MASAASAAGSRGSHPSASGVPETAPSTSTAESLSWAAVVRVFERLVQLNVQRGGRAGAVGKAEQRRKLVLPPMLMKAVRERGESIFPYIRLVLPQLDTQERPRYQLKEAKIADLYIDVYGIHESHEHARMLKNYRTPVTSHGRRASTASHTGDFASVLWGVALDRMTDRHFEIQADGKRHEKSSDWTVKMVNDWLDQVAAAHDYEKRKKLFQRMILELPPTEQKWLIRVIVGDMKIGVKQDSVLSWYHPDALECYNSSLDLRTVFADPTLRDPLRRRKYTIRLCQPFQPMTAAKLLLDERKGEFLRGWDEFFIERKLDGERMVLHLRRPTDAAGVATVKVFSRNNIEMDDYALLMHSYVVAALPCTEAILDGEMLAWDDDEKAFLAFGENKTVMNAMMANPKSRRHLCYVAFDLLWVAGWEAHPELTGDVTQLPLSRRKPLLDALLRRQDHYIEVLPTDYVSEGSAAKRKDHMIRQFERAIDNGDEGIMLKKATSHYEFGTRSDEWLKVKPEYAEGAFETLDCVVLGGYFGEGTRRAKDISHFLLGVADVDGLAPVASRESAASASQASARSAGATQSSGSTPTAASALPPGMQWRTFVKVGSGYNMEELRKAQDFLRTKWLKVRTDRPALPKYFAPWKAAKREDVPDVVVDDPGNSLVMEIKGAELTGSASFSAGYTVRFPRVVRIRDDKPVAEAATMRDVLNLLSRGGGRMARVAVDGEYGDAAGVRASRRAGEKRARMAIRGATSAMLPQYAFSSGENVEVEVNVLDGAKVVILPQSYLKVPAPYNSVTALQDLARRLGGEPIANYSGALGVQYIIGDEMDLKTRHLAEKHGIDILRPLWLMDCLEARSLVQFEPEHVLHASAAMKERLALVVDEFGEHHTRPTTAEHLRDVMAKVPVPDSAITADARWFWKLTESWDEDELAAFRHEYSLFRDVQPGKLGAPSMPGGCVAYFDVFPVVRTDKTVMVEPMLLSPLELVQYEFRLYRGVVAENLAVPDLNLVIVDAADVSGVERLSVIRRGLARHDTRAYIVRYDWVRDSVDAGRVLPVDKYLVL